ncbi:unnamed protein product [Clonostachys rosea f. rosea IK726]|uniref:Uncharacterized protein n=1 Tax=Clonostachys rosea f. rosea IK726 TaxID=1349383 RepID=A0ACA9U709_BIOOC|nr:unnamed protein product [Clonostachys rosea f. rosea IK726]
MAATSSAVVVIVVVVVVGFGVVAVVVVLAGVGAKRQTDGRELPLVATTLAIMIQERANSTRTYVAPYRMT